jgi:hypothetical protein
MFASKKGQRFNPENSKIIDCNVRDRPQWTKGAEPIGTGALEAKSTD